MQKQDSGQAAQGSGESRCPACGAVFSCGIAAGGRHCWCMDKPAGLPVPRSGDARCYCPACLEKRRQAASAPLGQ